MTLVLTFTQLPTHHDPCMPGGYRSLAGGVEARSTPWLPGPRRATSGTDPCELGDEPMWRIVVKVVVAVVAAAAWSRYRARQPSMPRPVTGMFGNGMAYARWGAGTRTLLLIPGGPGNLLPSRLRLPMYVDLTRPLVQEGYTAWLVTRKQGMPQGHGLADMADDYAGLLRDEFGGRVDAVVGVSTGGLIGFPLAARHPGRLGRIALLAAGYAATGPAAEADLVYARLLAEGRTASAIGAMTGYAFSWSRRFGIARVLGTLMAPIAFRDAHAAFRRDTLIEAEAEVDFDARSWLPDIRVPVLLVGGGADQFFTREVMQETARLIPGSRLRIYEGRDHVGALRDERLPSDLFDFVHGSDLPAQRPGGPHRGNGPSG